MKHKRRSAFFTSLVSLLLCVAMLAGTTFAWFTDTVTSSINRIAAGNLDITLEYLVGDQWKQVKEDTNVFNENALWEPGHTEVVYLRISNAGELALKYQLGVHITKETGSINAKGNPFVLSDYIEFSAIKDVKTPYASREDARKAVASSSILSAGYNQQDTVLPGGEPHYVALVVYMPESVGNDANHATGVEAPHIELGLHLFATQQTHESDSFGNSYDSAVEFPLNNVNVTVAAPIHNNAENGVIASAMSVGNTGSGITATIPQGVALDDGANALTLSVKSLETSEANIALQQGESKTSLDIHIDGVAADNTVPMLITLDGYFPTGLNSTSVALYHVENGVTLQMTPVTNLTNHNEFRYDPATGTVVLCVASFSEYVAVTDDFNRWEGTLNTDWYNTTDTEFKLTTAEELAGFGKLVDEGNTFEGKTVKLDKNIDLGGKISFNPIGYGYANNGGHPFSGTFDGNGKIISGLYQNGWELGLSYCAAGGGLFASVANGTVKNLTITNANIVMECVEMGIVVGLSQGDCTYKNINIYNSKIANYQRYTGGVVGEVSALNGKSTHNFINVHVGPTTTVGSLWGDFDASCGGIIGGKWDSTGITKVNMTDCTVACKLDVYNDITSSYQWYAYRRAGMLIGYSEEPAGNVRDGSTAAASYLNCSNVKVYYDTWVNYSYCQFSNEQNSGRSWPWVRVEAGENCSAYSNPRYGHPIDIKGTTVTNDVHYHQPGDACRQSIPFNQLYGGGQGVYGAVSHPGVTIATIKYDIVYMDGTDILAVEYITDNSAPHTVQSAGNGYQWLDSEGSAITEISAGNTKDVVLHKDSIKTYIAHFVNREGIEIYSETFPKGATSLKNEPAVPQIDGYVGQWEPYKDILKNATGSIVIKPMYTLASNAGILGTDVDLKELFAKLAAGESVVMSKDMVGTTGNAKATCCSIPEGKHGRLNMNTYELDYTFSSNANKEWTIFDIKDGASLTLSGGIDNEGVLKMNITTLNSNVNNCCVFNVQSGGKLVLEKGVVIEVDCTQVDGSKVNAILTPNGELVWSQYPGLTVTEDNGITRIVVTDTTIIDG